VADFPSHHSIKLPSFSTYVDKLIEKSLLLGFVAKQSSHLVLTEAGFEWLEMGREEKAMAIFKHPFHQVKSFDMHSDRNIHEIENSLSRIANLGWVLFEDFFKGSTVALKEEKKVRLKKEGRKWHYAIPTYSDEERQYIEAVMLGYLFESGIVRLGLFGSDIAFRITELGCSLFETP
jgi:hypothetical protein